MVASIMYESNGKMRSTGWPKIPSFLFSMLYAAAVENESYSWMLSFNLHTAFVGMVSTDFVSRTTS
jgi:hypothetical protein